MTTKDQKARIAEIRSEIESVHGYMQSNTAALKKVRRVGRGVDSHKKKWELEAREARYQQRLDALTAELEELEAL